MKITVINKERNEKRYTRVDLDEFVEQLKDGTYRQKYVNDYEKEVCFAAQWHKWQGAEVIKENNRLVLLSVENLRDLPTSLIYKELASQQLYTMLCFIGHDGRSLHIVCHYDVTGGETSETTQVNAFRKLQYIYSSQLGTQITANEPTFGSSCKVSYDPQAYYNPEALSINVSTDAENTPEYRSIQEDISDYNYPEEIPGLSVRNSRMRKFHDCLDAAIEKYHDISNDELFQMAVLEQLADGCHIMGLPQAWCARVASFIPILGGDENRDAIESAFKTAYLKKTLKTIPLKFTRPSAILTYKTEAYMKEHYTLRLNVMTGVPEYRMNAVGYGFMPLDQAARNTMTIKALKAGVDSWDKDLSRYIDSNLIPHYYPMEDYLRHLPRWNNKHDYVGELARRIKTNNPYWENDFHIWMLSMVAQWLGKDRQHGNAIVPLLIGPQGSGKSTFCRRMLPEFLQMYYNDRISMKNDNDIFLAMSGYALINIDEFDAMSKTQQPILKYLISKHDVKFRPPYGKTMEQRQRFASFIATTNNLRPLTDPTGSRRFICIYADEIDNSGIINYDQLYSQLCQELQEGRRYWFEDEENERIIHQNENFQQVFNLEKMIELTFLPPEETSEDTKPTLLQDIMDKLSKKFPTFTIRKNTDIELGRKLTQMGYTHKKITKGSAFAVKESKT